MPSGGTILRINDADIYADNHIARRVKHSTSATTTSPDQADMDSWGQYQRALQSADVESLRRTCAIRGIDVRGMPRNNIIDKLHSSFKFLYT